MFLRDLFRFLPRSPLRRALGALNRGEFDQAAALLESMLQGYRTPPRDLCNYACDAYAKAAQQRREAGDLPGARRCLERAILLQPTFADMHFHLGEIYEQLDTPDLARAAYERAMALNPRYVKARLALARLLTQHGETDLALRHLEDAAALAPDSAPGLSRPAAVPGAPVDAQSRLETLFAAFEAAPPSALEDGVDSARRALRTGDQRRAIEVLQQLVRTHADYPDLHNLLGVAYDSEGMLDDAVEEFEAAVALNPDYVEARLNLGLALFHRGRHDDASRHLRWVEDHCPGHELVRNVLAQIGSAEAHS